MIKSQIFGIAIMLGASMAAQAHQTFAAGSGAAHQARAIASFARAAASGHCVSGHAPVPIPEPETYAMLLAGLGLMSSVIRRRRRH